MHLKTLAFAALAAASSAETIRFTRLAPQLPGLSRRDDSPAYLPQETECGDGATCAEACGAGFEECRAGAGVSSCFNPDAGESCCTSFNLGDSCQAGYYCALIDAEVACCADGTPLEECTKPSAPESDATASGDESSPSESSAASTGDSDDAESGESESEGDDPAATPDAPGNAPAGLVPGVVLVAGVFALLL